MLRPAARRVQSNGAVTDVRHGTLGIVRAEMWVKVTAQCEAPPIGAAESKYLLLATRSPATVEYLGHQTGHTAQ